MIHGDECFIGFLRLVSHPSTEKYGHRCWESNELRGRAAERQRLIERATPLMSEMGRKQT
jgi:hypothetical protein